MQHLMKLGSHGIAAGAGWVLLAVGLWWLVSASVWGSHKAQDAAGNVERKAPADKQKKDDDELKSRLGRSLSEALDDEGEGDDDQRDLIRKILQETDEQLVEILDGDLRETIRAANRPLQLPACLTEPCGPPTTKKVPPPATEQTKPDEGAPSVQGEADSPSL